MLMFFPVSSDDVITKKSILNSMHQIGLKMYVYEP